MLHRCIPIIVVDSGGNMVNIHQDFVLNFLCFLSKGSYRNPSFSFHTSFWITHCLMILSLNNIASALTSFKLASRFGSKAHLFCNVIQWYLSEPKVFKFHMPNALVIHLWKFHPIIQIQTQHCAFGKAFGLTPFVLEKPLLYLANS